MEWVETTAPSVSEALDAALDQLGVDEQEAEYEVLEEPQKGLFGRLRREARVRARVRPRQPRPKADRRDRRRRSRSDKDRDSQRPGSRTGRSRGGSPSAKSSGSAKRSSATPDSEQSPQKAVAGAKLADAADTEQRATQGASQGSSGRRRRNRRRGRGGANREGAAVTNDATTQSAASSDDMGVPGRAEAIDLDAQSEAVEKFLQGLVEAFGRPESTVTVNKVDDETLEAAVDGTELGLLVGPKGQTLQAMQELVRSMVQRRFVGQPHARVRLDVAGYRQRRREALERFTRSVAEEVLSSQQAKTLDPMAASDRKVVHDVANEIEGVETHSEGEEPSRRVVIQPA